jgi:thiol-disulfide isomerase/thioredoxin
MIEIPNNVVMLHTVDETNNYLRELKDNLIILNFYTNTCSVCKSFAPSFAAIQKEFHKHKVLFGKIDANELSLIAQQFNIMGVPHTIFVKNKEIVHSVSGGFPKPQFRNLVQDVLEKFFNVKTKTIDDSNLMYM